MFSFCKYILIFISAVSFAQVGIGTTTPNSSSILDVVADDAGILIPRLTIAQKNAITNPVKGLLIFQNNGIEGFWYYNGTNWQPLSGVDNDWTIAGNNIHNANSGNVGIGTITPSVLLDIEGSIGTPTLVYSEDFSSAVIGNTPSTGLYVIDNNTVSPWLSDPYCNSGNVWSVSTMGSCTNCSGNKAYIQSGGSRGCFADNILVSGQFTAATISNTIAFDYNFVESIDDSYNLFEVNLYNETTNTNVLSLLTLTETANGSYNQPHSLIIGNTYSLRFQFKGKFDDETATVDNIMVSEVSAISSILRIADGTEGVNKVLVSDANGNASWKTLSLIPGNRIANNNQEPKEKEGFYRTKGVITTNGRGLALIRLNNKPHINQLYLNCPFDFAKVKIEAIKNNTVYIKTNKPNIQVSWLYFNN